jgi:hypothetical protein
MKRRSFILLRVIVFLFLLSLSSFAADPIQLPSPQMEGGNPLMQALKNRMTTRTFAQEKLPMQPLSNLLWAAFGINRPDGRRTAPSARNWQEMDIYVAIHEGLFLWDAHKNALNPILAKDMRALTGTHAYVGEAAARIKPLLQVSGSEHPSPAWFSPHGLPRSQMKSRIPHN